MLAILLMLAGLLIGFRLVPKRLIPRIGKYNARLQTVLVAVLIFMMGLRLGSREDFWTELSSLGVESLALAVLPILGSIAAVVAFTHWFPPRRKEKED